MPINLSRFKTDGDGIEYQDGITFPVEWEVYNERRSAGNYD